MICPQLLLAFSLILASSAKATVAKLPSNNPYQAIVLRNTFALTLSHPEMVKPPPPALPLVELLGIALFPPQEFAIVRVRWPGTESAPKRERTYVLEHHQKIEEIELLQIDELGATIRLNIADRSFRASF
jgi:hypothetical protein